MLPATVPWDYDDTMTGAIAFDTHRFVKNLTASGFTEAQAEALAEEQVHLLNSNLATMADISAVESNLRDEIQAVEKNLQSGIQTVRADFSAVEKNLQSGIQTVRADFSAVERNLQVEIHTFRADLLKWMVTAMIAQTGLVVALVRLL